MPARGGSSTLMRPFVVLALPGMYLLYKYNQYRQQQMETARRRVTERELMHLNTKIKTAMSSLTLLSRTRDLLSHLLKQPKSMNQNWSGQGNRSYAKKCETPSDCRKAIVEIPPDEDPICAKPCERRKKKKKEGILYKIKLKMIEGGTNFGTPFRRVDCKNLVPPVCKEVVATTETKPEVLPPPKRDVIPTSKHREGMQVSVLGADTDIGQYVALLLKKCPCIKKLRLYEATDTQSSVCNRDLCDVVRDLHKIDTNCRVQAFSCTRCELEQCLQNSDIVLMLESGYVNSDMSFKERFCFQAPIVKQYTDCIATECPKAFVIVCATPIDCMVPLVAETLKETGWYDRRKVLGSLAVPEMRASTLAARALGLEPRYTRVPCVGGTEGNSLVPLFSKAVEYFDFATHNALLMTDAVRHAPLAVARSDGSCMKAAELSEAHALAGLVTKVASALLCQDIPRVSGFVETDPSYCISPASFLAVDLLLNHKGVYRQLQIPANLSNTEMELLDVAFNELVNNVDLALSWYAEILPEECVRRGMQAKKCWITNIQLLDRVKACREHLL